MRATTTHDVGRTNGWAAWRNAGEHIARIPTWLLSRANARAQRALHDVLRDAGARRCEYRLLVSLCDAGPMSQAELGRRAGMDPNDVAVTVAALEEHGAVVREADASDSRRKRVGATGRGHDERRRPDRVVGDVQRAVVGPLSAAEARTLVALLAKLDVDPR